MGEKEEGCVVNRRFAGYSRLASFSLVHTDSAPSILVNKLSCGGEPCQLYHLESHPHMHVLGHTKGLSTWPGW